jgi:hypothetical protein
MDDKPFREYRKLSVPRRFIDEKVDKGKGGITITYNTERKVDLINKLRSAGFPIPPAETGKSALISAGPTIALHADVNPVSGSAFIVIHVPEETLLAPKTPENEAFLKKIDGWIDQAYRILNTPGGASRRTRRTRRTRRRHTLRRKPAAKKAPTS